MRVSSPIPGPAGLNQALPQPLHPRCFVIHRVHNGAAAPLQLVKQGELWHGGRFRAARDTLQQDRPRRQCIDRVDTQTCRIALSVCKEEGDAAGTGVQGLLEGPNMTMEQVEQRAPSRRTRGVAVAGALVIRREGSLVLLNDRVASAASVAQGWVWLGVCGQLYGSRKAAVAGVCLATAGSAATGTR